MALLVVTLSVMFAAFMSGTEAQSNSLPSCDELFEELTGNGFRVFVNVFNPESFTRIQQRDCLNNQFEVEHYYHCPEESSAFIPRFDTANTRNDLSMVIDLDALRVQLNVTVLAAASSAPPPPPTPAPRPPSIGRCPRGPTRINQYLFQDQPKLCQVTCSFGTAVEGIPTGTRTRTIYRCCIGEPILRIRASRLYACP